MTAPTSTRAPRPADDGPPTTLVLVRHGRTELTLAGRFSGGDGPDPDLSEQGHRDARAVADLLRGNEFAVGPLADLARPDVLVTSPLARTRQTAEAIGDAVGLTAHVEPGVKEVGFGEWDGLTYAEVAQRYPAELAAWQGSATLAPPGGESLVDLRARVGATWRRLVAEHRGRTVAVVSHVTPVRCIVADALDAGWPALWSVRVSPCSVTVVRFWSDGNGEVVTVNSTSHLAAAHG